MKGVILKKKKSSIYLSYVKLEFFQ